MRLCIFEDYRYRYFLPLTYTRPVFQLRYGSITMLQYVAKALGMKPEMVICRELVAKKASWLYPEIQVNRAIQDDVREFLFVNCRVIPSKRDLYQILDLGPGEFLQAEDTIYAFRPKNKEELDRVRKSMFKPLECKPNANMREIKYYWDLIAVFENALKETVKCKEVEFKEANVIAEGTSGLHVGKDTKFYGHIFIDCTKGPVFIGRNVRLGHGTTIEGPAYIGSNTYIMPSTRLSTCYIGSVCRVGGEVECSIVEAYTNKYHYGFLGHSYVGSWVNIGAGTTTSDLKNTYGTIRVYLGSKRVETGLIKLGACIGDHSKTSIGCLIYSGISIGTASHVHGIVTRNVPPFTMFLEGIGAKNIELNLKSAILTYRRMCKRRDVEPSTAEEEILWNVFEMTSTERRKMGIMKGKITLP